MTRPDQPSVLSELKRGERRVEWGAAALGLTLLIQTAGIIWWGAKLDQRVASVEQKVAASSSDGQTIARLDERTSAMLTTIDRIDRRLTASEDRGAR